MSQAGRNLAADARQSFVALLAKHYKKIRLESLPMADAHPYDLLRK
jgi:hypothetical protein